MTEQEAKTKWCPAFRGNDHGVNRPHELITDAGHGFCIGSACMAWRTKTWTEEIHSEPSATSIGVRYEHRADSWCGLAGKP